jgi:hypothetical protein
MTEDLGAVDFLDLSVYWPLAAPLSGPCEAHVPDHSPISDWDSGAWAMTGLPADVTIAATRNATMPAMRIGVS